jgi:simple sugar transport system permease protein
MTAKTTARTSAANKALLLLLAALIGIGLTLFVSLRLFDEGELQATLNAMTATPDFQNVLFINALVGISVALFVLELRAAALRVTVTVIIALIFGFLMTLVFNLDSSSRFIRGEFVIRIQSEAEPIENDALDLAYNLQRGGEFNRPQIDEPLREAAYTFEGRAGDSVTILAYAANRRSQVNMQVELIDPNNAVIASATSATEPQLEAYEDLQSVSDAVIENFMLPADGVYTLRGRPEDIPFGIAFGEAFDDTVTAYDAFLLGALGRVGRWSDWIKDALTLILVGLAIAIVFRARQFSLGAEGQIYFGALASGIVALNAGTTSIWLIVPLALLASMTVGFLWGLLPGVLKAYLGANELVATLMLNAIAVRFYELVLTFQLKPADAGYVSSAPFPINGQLPLMVQGTQVTVAVFLVIIAVIAVWLLITRTPLGYEIRTVGNSLKFANYGGINTKRTIMLAMAVSGILAGLAGAHLAAGIHGQLLLNISLGLAFEGVVVALLARNNPLVIPFTGLLYAYLRAGAQFMERDANISFEVVRIIQAVIILLITADALLNIWQRRRTVTTLPEPSTPTTTSESPRLIVPPSEGKARV